MFVRVLNIFDSHSKCEVQKFLNLTWFNGGISEVKPLKMKKKIINISKALRKQDATKG